MIPRDVLLRQTKVTQRPFDIFKRIWMAIKVIVDCMGKR